MQKAHVENFFLENSQKIDKNFEVSFSSTFFVLLCLKVLLGDGSSKALQKTVYKTNRVEKVFTKKSTKKLFFLLRFWAFLGERSLIKFNKHDKKISHKNLTSPGTFLASEEPTNHPKVRRFFFECPVPLVDYQWIGYR
jgi:hypothetical protein